MSDSRNAILPFLRWKQQDLGEAIGITQFPSETEWHQTIGGLVIQGNKVAVASGVTATISLPAPCEKQILGIWLQPVGDVPNAAYITSVTLTSFDLVNGVGDRTYYWLSLGV